MISQPMNWPVPTIGTTVADCSAAVWVTFILPADATTINTRLWTDKALILPTFFLLKNSLANSTAVTSFELPIKKIAPSSEVAILKYPFS